MSKLSADTLAALAAFNAKGGKVEKVETGARAYDDRALYLAARDGGRALSVAERERRAEDRRAERAERAHHAAHEAYASARINGACENDAWHDAEQARSDTFADD